MKLYTKNLYTEKVNVFFSYALLVWVFVFTTKTFFSGFHLSDDQILIYFNNHLHQQSFFSAAYSEIKSDLFLRFRPLAIFYYLTLAKWPYPDFNIISLIVGWQGIFSCYFFYRFARDLKCSLAVSFMFPLFLLCGNQGVIFWRNCVNETFAIFLLSLSFFFLGKLFSTKINERWNTILFALFLLLSTLTKESFIILVPAVLFLKIWKEVINYNGFLFSLKQNKKLIIFFIIIVITEIATIYYYKKHSSIFIEYVSIDENTFSITNLLTSTIRLWITKGYLIIIIPVITFIIFIKKKYTPEDIRSFFLPLALLFLLITIPQILLYSKSLIFERYLLPGTLSSALAILFLHLYIKRNQSILFLNKIFLLACTLMLCFQIALMSRGAINYANTGYQVKDMLRTIMLHTEITDTILLVANPLGQSDQALSTKIYLNSKIGGKRNSVFIEPLIDTTLHLSITHNSVIESFKHDTKGITYNDIAEKKKISCITFFENTIERFSSLYPEFDTTHYSKINAGKFLILVRK